jgi:hypothetical protein
VDRLFDGRGDAGRGRRGFAAAARIMPVPAAGGPESPVRLQPQQQPTPPPQPTPLRRWDRDDALRRSSDGEEEEEEAEEATFGAAAPKASAEIAWTATCATRSPK